MHARVRPRGRDAAAAQGSKKFEVSRRSRSKVDRVRWPEAALLTTADVARVLGISRWGVTWLVRQGTLAAERTISGQYVFRRGEVLGAAQERAEARLVPVPRVIVGRYEHSQLRLPIGAARDTARLAGVRPRMAKAAWKEAKPSLPRWGVKARGIA